MHYNDVPAVSMNNAANNDAASAALQSINLSFILVFLCVILGKFHRSSKFESPESKMILEFIIFFFLRVYHWILLRSICVYIIYIYINVESF